jgi:hypothetical protein
MFMPNGHKHKDSGISTPVNPAPQQQNNHLHPITVTLWQFSYGKSPGLKTINKSYSYIFFMGHSSI